MASIIDAIAFKTSYDNQKDKKKFTDYVKKEKPRIYEEYKKHEKELNKITIKEYQVNYEAIRENNEELKKITYYVPLVLKGRFFHKPNKEARQDEILAYQYNRVFEDDRYFMDLDLFYWAEQHPQWKTLITIKE